MSPLGQPSQTPFTRTNSRKEARAMSQIIPPAVELAAKRGFLRTTAQAYAATLTTALPSATVIVATLQDPTAWLLAGITVGLALVSPIAAGAASYLSITAKGLPDDYLPAALDQAETR